MQVADENPENLETPEKPENPVQMIKLPDLSQMTDEERKEYSKKLWEMLTQKP